MCTKDPLLAASRGLQNSGLNCLWRLLHPPPCPALKPLPPHPTRPPGPPSFAFFLAGWKLSGNPQSCLPSYDSLLPLAVEGGGEGDTSQQAPLVSLYLCQPRQTLQSKKGRRTAWGSLLASAACGCCQHVPRMWGCSASLGT